MNNMEMLAIYVIALQHEENNNQMIIETVEHVR
jgi:hypothetical protein